MAVKDFSFTFSSTTGTLGYSEEVYDKEMGAYQSDINKGTKSKLDSVDASLAECAKKTDLDSINTKIDSLPKDWVGTQAEYDALTEFDENVKYYIV